MGYEKGCLVCVERGGLFLVPLWQELRLRNGHCLYKVIGRTFDSAECVSSLNVNPCLITG